MMPVTPDSGRPAGLEPNNSNTSLLELLDRVVEKGVVLGGDLTLSVADIDLLYLGVRLLLCSVDRIPMGSPVRDR
jgi:hypothetical protein